MIQTRLRTTAFSAYVQHLERSQRAPATVYRNRQHLRRFERWMRTQGHQPETLTPPVLDEYVNGVLRGAADGGSQLSSVSRHGHLVTIRAAFDWAIDVDILDAKNPCRRVSVRVRRPSQRFYSSGELRSILASCATPEEFLLTTTLLFTGLRIGEFAGLRRSRLIGRDRFGERVELSWVDLDGRRLHIFGKGDRPRDVPLHPVLAPLVEQAMVRGDSPFLIGNLSNGPLWTSGLLRILTRPVMRAGLKTAGVGAHAYRRAFNETLRINGRGYELERRLILGHSIERDINASRYSQPSLTELASLVRMAYQDDPLLPTQLVA